MKKIYNKLTQQNWRVTVPNINSPFFTKKKLQTNSDGDQIEVVKTYGSYDLEAAQKEFDRRASLPDIYVNEYNSSETEDEFLDATSSSRSRSRTSNNHDCELYVDVDSTKKLDNISSNVDQKVDGDVPRISFQFFENTSKKTDNILKSEVQILVTDSHESAEIITEPKRSSCEILPIVGIVKCGSDPNLVNNRSEEPDDNLYKIPKSLQDSATKRLSRSLSDVEIDVDFQLPVLETDDASSIEHISCSQIIRQSPSSNEANSENFDYCKVRSRLPLKLRRPTFLRKPKNIAGSWSHIKTRLNHAIVEQAEKQRVGAYDDNQKLTINLEEMYQNSKTKCKNALKLFIKKKPDNELCDGNMVKNDAFFSRLTPQDIEYKFNYNDNNNVKNISGNSSGGEEFNFLTNVLRRDKSVTSNSENQNNGFEDLRRYVKHGGDFTKELATILQERADAESQYAKNLSKLSCKLLRACKEGLGGVNEAWRAVAIELETRAEAHRLLGSVLLEETAKPLRNLNEKQHRTRKQCEVYVDKAAKSLHEWRTAEAKAKKISHSCARDNEKLQDAAFLDTKANKLTLSKNSSFIQLHKNNSEKDNAKLEGKKKKAEDAVKKADIEYYTLCVRAERARLEWESSMLRGVNTFQCLEEERLKNLNIILKTYYQRGVEIGPKLLEAIEKLQLPIQEVDPEKDLNTFFNIKSSYQQISEQLLPDFYCEHITLAMNRERRKQALVKLLQLIRQDIERERKSKNGLENLSKAMKETPNFGTEDSQQSVTEKIYHMKSMLTYLEGARYKVHSALAELDNRPKSGHPLAPHIVITRDKCGLQQSILKVPQWLREELLESQKSPLSEKSDLSDLIDPDPDWFDRGAGDGNSNQPDSDFDEFSSQCSSSGNNCIHEVDGPVQPIAQCKALYAYTPNLTDELPLQPGDLLSVYRQQDDGWWLGECRGSVGIFPATYVEIIQNNEIKQP